MFNDYYVVSNSVILLQVPRCCEHHHRAIGKGEKWYVIPGDDCYYTCIHDAQLLINTNVRAHPN